MKQKKTQDKRTADDELFDSAIAGDLNRARAAIKAGASLHVTGDPVVESNPVVTHAAESGNARLVKFLLAAGAKRPPFDDAAIQAAVGSENTVMVKALLKHWQFEPEVYQDLLGHAIREKNEVLGKLLAGYCSPREQEEFKAFLKQRSLDRRIQTQMTNARKALQGAPAHPRAWEVDNDGIIVCGTWDDVLGKQLRMLNAKWLNPGWRLAFRQAAAFATALMEYPSLRAESDHKEAEAEKAAHLALAQLSEVSCPTGYKLRVWGGNIEVAGNGNSELEKQLDETFRKETRQVGRGMACRFEKYWVVAAQQVSISLAGIFRRFQPHLITKAAVKEILHKARLPERYNLEVKDDQILVEGPWSQDLVFAFRKLGGVWHKDPRHWAFPWNAAEQLRQILARFAPSDKLVEQARTVFMNTKTMEGCHVNIQDNGIFVHIGNDTDLLLELRRLTAKWNQDDKTWYLPLSAAEHLANLFRDLPGQLVEAKSLLKQTKLAAKYSCQMAAYYISVSGPYSKAFANQFRSLGGIWNPEEQQWVFCLRHAARLAVILRRT